MNRSKGKRNAEAAFSNDAAKSPYMPIFESIRDELDTHHDRRERIIKASRDITAASKKIIFALQRIRQVGSPIPNDLRKFNEWDIIRSSYKAICKDLQGINAYRYANNITGGNQELMEAVAFQHYLESQTLISQNEARQKLAGMFEGDERVMLSDADYVLGIFDMTGELMRFAITSMATGMQMNTAERTVLSDMRELRGCLELLDPSGSSLSRDYGKKMNVMQESVEKVEKASYSQIVRGSERPKGWIPDLENRREEVEVA